MLDGRYSADPRAVTRKVRRKLNPIPVKFLLSSFTQKVLDGVSARSSRTCPRTILNKLRSSRDS